MTEPTASACICFVLFLIGFFDDAAFLIVFLSMSSSRAENMSLQLTRKMACYYG